MENFAFWLETQLKNRDWQVSDLARKAGVYVASVSRILNGTRKPGPGICLNIARALNLPPEEVFRRAGLLPPQPGVDAEAEEMVHLFQQLEKDKRKLALSTLRVWVEGSKEK